MRRTLLAISLLLSVQRLGTTQPSARGSAPSLSAADVADAHRRLLALVRDTDVGNADALYMAQEDGMPLVDGVFTFGSAADRRDVLIAAAERADSLPLAGSLTSDSGLTGVLARLERLSGMFARARQRVASLPFSLDGLAMPTGPARMRRVYPMVAGDKINVGSEVELQYAYLLSTIVRSEAERLARRADTLDAPARAAVDSLASFLMHDKVRFYWDEAPAWHWSGPFPNMRDRVAAKLAGTAPRVTRPPWFGAMLDHELLLFGVAADLRAARAADPALAKVIDASDVQLLDEIWRASLQTLRTRVTSNDGRGFRFDYGLWTTNPSYAYAGCAERDPVPAKPCPVDSVATDASHALRWPWWLRSYRAAAASNAREASEITGFQRRLAHQLATYVLYDSASRPLTRNYMDGRDGWYRLRETPQRQWGNGPSSLTGSMRYGSWGLLASLEPRIADAERRFCAALSSTDPADIAWRTRFYGSPSDRPGLAGLGERDLYGASSPSALTCRISASLSRF